MLFFLFVHVQIRKKNVLCVVSSRFDVLKYSYFFVKVLLHVVHPATGPFGDDKTGFLGFFGSLARSNPRRRGEEVAGCLEYFGVVAEKQPGD